MAHNVHRHFWRRNIVEQRKIKLRVVRFVRLDGILGLLLVVEIQIIVVIPYVFVVFVGAGIENR